MKNKKAILIPEILKLVIGALIIVFLFVAAIKIYGIVQSNSDRTQAASEIEVIARTINGLGEGDVGKYDLLSPSGWALYGFPYGNVKTIRCEISEFCVCLCPKASVSMGSTVNPRLISEEEYFKSYRDSCDSQGVCSKVEKEVFVNNINLEFKEIKTFILVDDLVEAKKSIAMTIKNDKAFVNFNDQNEI
ncbi:MAG: hypothetical protein WC796_01695 [Candidatus Pacearchaeota archaeon]|jgi:hypothetical protein